MPESRVTQVTVETLRSGVPNARVTQVTVEVLRSTSTGVVGGPQTVLFVING